MTYNSVKNLTVCFLTTDTHHLIGTVDVKDYAICYKEHEWNHQYFLDNTFNPDLMELLFNLYNFDIYQIMTVVNEKTGKVETLFFKSTGAGIHEYQFSNIMCENYIFCNALTYNRETMKSIPRDVEDVWMQIKKGANNGN